MSCNSTAGSDWTEAGQRSDDVVLMLLVNLSLVLPSWRRMLMVVDQRLGFLCHLELMDICMADILCHRPFLGCTKMDGYLKVWAQQQRFNAREGLWTPGMWTLVWFKRIRVRVFVAGMFLVWLPCLLDDIQCTTYCHWWCRHRTFSLRSTRSIDTGCYHMDCTTCWNSVFSACLYQNITEEAMRPWMISKSWSRKQPSLQSALQSSSNQWQALQLKPRPCIQCIWTTTEQPVC